MFYTTGMKPTKELLKEAWDAVSEGEVKPEVVWDSEGMKIRTWNDCKARRCGDPIKRRGKTIGYAIKDTDWRENDLWYSRPEWSDE